MSFKQVALFRDRTSGGRPVFNVFSYENKEDTLAEVTAPDYFDRSRFPLKEGAIINALLSDGYYQLEYDMETETANPKGAGASGLTEDEIAEGIQTSRFNSNLVARSLGLKLKQSELSVNIVLLGDSTGNETTEWLYRSFSSFVEQNYPSHSLYQSSWNSIDEYYDTPELISVGDSGEAYVYLSKDDNTTCSVSYDSNNFDITEDLDVRHKLSVADFSGNGEGIILSWFGVSGERSWALGITSNKEPYLWWSEDGTSLTGGTGTAASEPLPFDVDDVFCVRATLDVDNGSSGYTIQYFTSTDDGETWDKLGDDFIGGPVTSIYNSQSNILTNGRGTGQVNMNFYRAEVRDGIDGRIVASPIAAYHANDIIDLNPWKDLQGNDCECTSATGNRQGSPVVMLINGSVPGAQLEYSSDVDRFEKQTPIEPEIFYVSYSHNEGAAGAIYGDVYPAFIEQILSKYPLTNIVPVTQNPKKSPSTDVDIRAHSYRAGLIAKIAANKSLQCVDSYQAFLDTGDPDAYIDPDGVHPLNPEGNQLWADANLRFLENAK